MEILAIFVTFGAENFVRRPVVLLTEGVQNLRLAGVLTLIAITHGNLGRLMNLTRYPEQTRENVRKFDVKRSIDSWTKIKVQRHTLIQYLLQQNRFGTGEDETLEKEEDVRRRTSSSFSSVSYWKAREAIEAEMKSGVQPIVDRRERDI